MQGIIEAIGIHIGAEMHEYQGNSKSNEESIEQIIKDLKTPAVLENAILYRDHNSLKK